MRCILIPRTTLVKVGRRGRFVLLYHSSFISEGTSPAQGYHPSQASSGHAWGGAATQAAIGLCLGTITVISTAPRSIDSASSASSASSSLLRVNAIQEIITLPSWEPLEDVIEVGGDRSARASLLALEATLQCGDRDLGRLGLRLGLRPIHTSLQHLNDEYSEKLGKVLPALLGFVLVIELYHFPCRKHPERLGCVLSSHFGVLCGHGWVCFGGLSACLRCPLWKNCSRGSF
ncbi:hypothetical protein B0T14DRAFT_340240 [Immersiella caudata]|uniref:Uncharacterized protein n=1 Tax=Immersiella caudata TaxID=314043 RepID=A0AA39TTH5_9PEZI|nr:hypothetical protein B0T14DRAFT_340240 [Immersiella caudata]